MNRRAFLCGVAALPFAGGVGAAAAVRENPYLSATAVRIIDDYAKVFAREKLNRLWRDAAAYYGHHVDVALKIENHELLVAALKEYRKAKQLIESEPEEVT